VVLNAIEILTATESQIMNQLGKTTAIDTIHSFLTDTLQTPQSNAVEMGAAYSYMNLTTPSRQVNLVEEIAIPIQVARPQQVIQHYHGQNELQRQLNKALLVWGNSAEFDIVRSTLVSGVSGTVAKMQGIENWVGTTSLAYTNQVSGTIWSSSILDALMINCWTNSNGDVTTDLYLGGSLRKQTDYFVQKTNVVVNNPSDVSDIVKTVTTYETAFGTLSIHKHRFVQQPSDTGPSQGIVLGIRPEKLKIAFLDKPYIQTDLATTGPFTPRAVYGSLTVENRNPLSHFYANGYQLI
jgi:hypothetical protein